MPRSTSAYSSSCAALSTTKSLIDLHCVLALPPPIDMSNQSTSGRILDTSKLTRPTNSTSMYVQPSSLLVLPVSREADLSRNRGGFPVLPQSSARVPGGVAVDAKVSTAVATIGSQIRRFLTDGTSQRESGLQGPWGCCRTPSNHHLRHPGWMHGRDADARGERYGKVTERRPQTPRRVRPAGRRSSVALRGESLTHRRELTSRHMISVDTGDFLRLSTLTPLGAVFPLGLAWEGASVFKSRGSRPGSRRCAP